MAKHRGKSKYGTVRYWIFSFESFDAPPNFLRGKNLEIASCIYLPGMMTPIISVLKAPQDNSPTCSLT